MSSSLYPYLHCIGKSRSSSPNHLLDWHTFCSHLVNSVMASLKQLLTLPASLLLLIAPFMPTATSEELSWPYNLPPHVKYYPKNAELIKRELQIQQRLQQEPAVGVKKMSDDPGEKFFLDYWSFESSFEELGNVTTKHTDAAQSDLDPPVPLHSDQNISSVPILARYARTNFFDKRGFQCPTNYTACTSIGQPDSCCANGQTCLLITDTGLGDVGCCPDGQSCGGSLSTCAPGYTSCPNNPGGGCCIPGYACYDVGCVLSSTATLYVTPTTSSTFSSIPVSTVTSFSITTDTTTVGSGPVGNPTSSTTSSSTSTSSTAPTTTITTTTLASTTSTISDILTCTPGFKSCPASLGGGCCRTGQACGSVTCPDIKPSTSSGQINPPLRGTSIATTTTTTSDTTTPGVGCPSNYYACSAFYPVGGCCQIGRNCQETSCPTSASTTVVSQGSVTAVAPTGSGITGVGPVTGSCGQGLFTCAQSIGGGCCPSGYGCGTARCTATVSGGQGNVVGKIAPESAASYVEAKVGIGAFTAAATVVLSLLFL